MLNNSSTESNLKMITHMVMSLLKRKDVVLPSTYKIVFSTIAKKYKIDIGAERANNTEEISEEMLQHTITMDNNANRAIAAMENKNDIELRDVIEDTKKLRKEIEALKQIAYEDSLTKALNRKWLEKNYLNEDSETFTKNGILVFIDLNDFKHINDTLGHAVGDKVLMHLSAGFKQLDAKVIRYGGDEFILIFDNKDIDYVKKTIENLRELHKKRKYKVLNNELKVKFAYGIEQFSIDDNFADVIKKADTKMYEDKINAKKLSA